MNHECGTLVLECCAKSRARHLKAIEALIATWDEEPELDDPRADG